MGSSERARKREPHGLAAQREPSKAVWQAAWLAHPEASSRVEQARQLIAHPPPFDAVRRAMVEQLVIEAAAIVLSDSWFAAVFTQRLVMDVLLADVLDRRPHAPSYLHRLRPEDTWTLVTSGERAEVAIQGRVPLDQIDSAKQYAEWQQAYLRDEDLALPRGRPRGSHMYTTSAFKSALEGVIRRSQDEFGRHPSRTDAQLQLQLDGLPMSQRTFDDLVRRCYPGRRWVDIA